MKTITITLPDQQWQHLQAIAAQLATTPEELVRLSVAQFLMATDPEFPAALEYVLQKNRELYRRLA